MPDAQKKKEWCACASSPSLFTSRWHQAPRSGSVLKAQHLYPENSWKLKQMTPFLSHSRLTPNRQAVADSRSNMVKSSVAAGAESFLTHVDFLWLTAQRTSAECSKCFSFQREWNKWIEAFKAETFIYLTDHGKSNIWETKTANEKVCASQMELSLHLQPQSHFRIRRLVCLKLDLARSLYRQLWVPVAVWPAVTVIAGMGLSSTSSVQTLAWLHEVQRVPIWPLGFETRQFSSVTQQAWINAVLAPSHLNFIQSNETSLSPLKGSKCLLSANLQLLNQLWILPLCFIKLHSSHQLN